MAPGVTAVMDRIAEEIRAGGPISFARFMELALYGPGGYYQSPPVGADLDFVTSPHVHPVFAQLLGRAIRELYGLLGSPDELALTEVGAGDGTLARALRETLHDLPMSFTAIERSAGGRSAMADIEGVRVTAELDEGPGIVIANELLDNLPFNRVRSTNEGPKEVRVGLMQDRLVEVLADPAGDLSAVDTKDLDLGDEAIHPEGALAFVDRLAETMTRGYALLIDYGAVGSSGGPPHGYRDHRVIEDLLANPGSTDITAGVDFSLISDRAQAKGLTALPSVSQRFALTELGFDEWIRGELEQQARMLNERDGTGAVRAWTGRSRATLLVDPGALGRHRWLLLASVGLPPPLWLAAG